MIAFDLDYRYPLYSASLSENGKLEDMVSTICYSIVKTKSVILAEKRRFRDKGAFARR